MDGDSWVITYQSIIASVVAAIISISVSFILFRRTENKENRYFHFQELRNRVITPMALSLNFEFVHIQSLEQIKTASMRESILPSEDKRYHIDGFLLQDFLNNHYPKYAVMWNELYELQTIVLKKRHEFNKMIDDILHRMFRAYGFETISKPKISVVSYDPFKSKIIGLMSQGKKPTVGFEQDNQEPKRIKFEGVIVYMMNNNEELKSTLTRFRHVLYSVLLNEDITKSIEEYQLLFEKKSEIVAKFRKEINT